MEEVKDKIVSKALRCIDEIYPAGNALNESFYSTDVFIDEAVRWVIDNVPVHVLPVDAVENKVSLSAPIIKDGMGSAQVSLKGRIIFVKEDGWKRALLGVIYDTDARYLQQKNRVLRGNNSRPVAALVQGKSELEWYPSNKKDNSTTSLGITVVEAPYDTEYIPSHLVDITAWKLAEIVLTSMHDVQSASICTAKVNEHLSIL